MDHREYKSDKKETGQSDINVEEKVDSLKEVRLPQKYLDLSYEINGQM